MNHHPEYSDTHRTRYTHCHSSWKPVMIAIAPIVVAMLFPAALRYETLFVSWVLLFFFKIHKWQVEDRTRRLESNIPCLGATQPPIRGARLVYNWRKVRLIQCLDQMSKSAACPEQPREQCSRLLIGQTT